MPASLAARTAALPGADNAGMNEPNRSAAKRPSSAAIEPATTPLPNLHRVEQMMGTAIVLDVRDGSVLPAALEEAFEYLRAVDLPHAIAGLRSEAATPYRRRRCNKHPSFARTPRRPTDSASEQGITTPRLSPFESRCRRWWLTR